ncbi:hypothetical protein OG413_17410 [Streptomyces sp. NBC_01433]|uniref:hypothetical protein n=1 Tax=Streptomyces sp. NBC_01433 TaxID=2903864 RepID=UPI00224CD848|nr:hypothetical protein [Streptomyces sp. NBC_01433]MCX4677058.1 hypothetical protein [Streptomyces sp. NBC_01433]
MPTPPGPSSEPSPETAPDRASDGAGDGVRWVVFSCLLVPAVLVVYGSSVGNATVSALGLASVTAVCRLLLCRSERATARGAEGAHRSGRQAGSCAPGVTGSSTHNH